MNFIECIKSRQQPHADVELGRLATTICHLGNITTHLRRDITFDPKTETFGHDKEANAYLTKKHRAPYTLPEEWVRASSVRRRSRSSAALAEAWKVPRLFDDDMSNLDHRKTPAKPSRHHIERIKPRRDDAKN